MSHRVLTAALLCALTAGFALAADPIRVELKDFTFRPDGKAPEDLIGYNAGEEKLFFYVNGQATALVKVPADGEYTITIEASCDEARGENAKMAVRFAELEVARSHTLTSTGFKEYRFPAKLKKGEGKLVIAFLNDTYKEGEYDSNLYIHMVKVEPKKADPKKVP